jgi:ATP-dependent Clp protease, protease subunit
MIRKDQKDKKEERKKEEEAVQNDGSRIIFISGEINEEVTRSVIHSLLRLQKDDPIQEIKLVIDSYGGYLDSMFAIADTMNLIYPEIETICIGKAMSAAAFIFVNGAKGKRYMTPHSTLMLHQASGATWGTTADIEIKIAQQRKMQELMIKELSDRSNLMVDEVRELIDRDCFLSPEDAIKIGICDGIITRLQ